MNDAP